MTVTMPMSMVDERLELPQRARELVCPRAGQRVGWQVAVVGERDGCIVAAAADDMVDKGLLAALPAGRSLVGVFDAPLVVGLDEAAQIELQVAYMPLLERYVFDTRAARLGRRPPHTTGRQAADVDAADVSETHENHFTSISNSAASLR